jgi:uncharacterized membrane protein
MDYVAGLLLSLFVLGIFLGLLFWFFVLPALLLGRVRRLDRRVTELERALEYRPPPVARPAAPEPRPADAAELPEALPVEEPPRRRPRPARTFHLESWLGARGLGWLAVVLLLFATAFFLKYAFDNEWIGPTGQVAFGLLLGAGLAFAGFRLHRRGGWLFGQMLTAAGIVLLYLTTFASFGYYHLVTQESGFVFLVALVVQSFALSLAYEAPAVALMAVVGGLLTPLLMHSETDQYFTLFVYLLVLDAGVVLVALARPWPALCTLALVGSQAIFAGWTQIHLHPEKLPWALGFQVALFLLFQGQLLFARDWRGRLVDIEALVRLVLLASLFGASIFALLWTDYYPWLGTLAVALAAVYAVLTWLALSRQPGNPYLQLVLIAVSMGFTALAIPLQAQAAWVPVGWAVQGLALWTFGLRVRNDVLRAMGFVLLVLAVGRLVTVDTPYTDRELFVPLLNWFAVPALIVAACLLAAAELSRRYHGLGRGFNRVVQVGLGLAGVLLVWFVVSNDVYDFFYLMSGGNAPRLLAQTVLSAVWAAYALAVLAVGLRLHSEPLRWTGLGLFALTFAKVFLYDTAELDGLYRVAVFLALSVMMAAAAYGYQKLQAAPTAARTEGSSHETV